MLSFLKNHPFAVEAYFDYSIVITFAVPKELLKPNLPSPLELDTFEDKWAFIAVAMVQTKGLRPKGFPSFMGNDFFLTGYRLFTRYTTSKGKRLRGLYILKSETDKKRMEWLGNLFTHYNYETIDIRRQQDKSTITIASATAQFNVVLNINDTEASLPSMSPFANWQEARRFAGPLPFTFTVNQQKNEVLIIEGVREHWTPAPIAVQSFNFPFLQTLNAPLQLANAFIIRNIPYYWKKGRTDKWTS